MTATLETAETAQAFRPGGAMAEWIAADPHRAARAGIVPAVQNSTNVVSSNVAAMHALFNQAPVSSGYPVTDYTSMQVGTVYACLSKIAGAVLQLPMHQYRQAIGGERERMEKSPLWWLLNEQPSACWTAASWKEWIVRCVHLRGDQFTEIVRNKGASAGGKVESLIPHHPDAVVVRRHVAEGGELQLVYDVLDIYAGKSRTVLQDDMLHFSGFGFDGLRSISAIQHAARNAVGNALASADFSGKSIGAGAMPKIALTYPNKLSTDQSDLLRKSFVATYGAGPTQQLMPLVLTEGGTAAPLTISPVDMQLLESRRFEREDICQILGVPPVMIGENEKTSSWGTGVEQITLGFVKFTLSPHLCRWEEEINRKLFPRSGMFVEFELDALLRGDSKAQAEAFRFALGGPGSGDGYMSVDEVRKLKNLPPLGGDFAHPFKAQRGTEAAANQAPSAP
jgi:HK97 family phage portal protein